jgi:HlyD family secretion protein
MTRKRKRVLGIVVLLVAAGGVAGALASRGPKRTVVQTGRVERIDALDSIVSASGEIRAKEFVDLQTEIAGVIVDLPVKEGDRVEKGAVLLRIDPFQAKQDVEAARAQLDAVAAEAGSGEVQIAVAEVGLARDAFALEAARAELLLAESNRDRLKAQYERRKGLYEKQVVSPDEFEAAESAYRIAEAQVRTSKARVDQAEAAASASRVAIDQWKKQHEAAQRRADAARANLERMQDFLSKTTITSPLSGVITRLNVEKGERAVPGILSNPQATLMTIADLSIIEAEIRVDETDIVNVSLADRAVVTVDALPDRPLEAHVTEIGNSPIGGTLTGAATQEGKDFKVVVRIENPPASLRPGLSASADIFVDRREDLLVIPLQAVTVREVKVDAEGRYIQPDPAELEAERDRAGQALAAPLPRDDRKVPKKELEGVFVREGERARFRPVKLGIKGESEVEILDGLAEGEEIVTGSYKVLRAIKDGDFIKVENRERDEDSLSRRRRSRRR